MKNKIILTLLTIGINFCYSQKEIKKGSYQFTENIIKDFSPLKEKKDNSKVQIDKYSKVTVVGMTEDLKTVYIKYWNYSAKIIFTYENISDSVETNTFNFTKE